MWLKFIFDSSIYLEFFTAICFKKLLLRVTNSKIKGYLLKNTHHRKIELVTANEFI